MLNVFYSPSYVVTEYKFDTTHKAKLAADPLVESPIQGVTLVEPMPVSHAQLGHRS